MQSFTPDYRQIEQAARNQVAQRLPLYEHLISTRIMEKILNQPFASLLEGDPSEQRSFFRTYCRFFQEMGYDTVSYECCIGPIMPGSGSLGGHKPGEIRSRQDFDRYPWAEIPDLFFQRYSRHFDLLRQVMPPGMKAVGGPGNGIFECVQDVVGYMDLCYIGADDPDLYADLFQKVAETNLQIWQRFLALYSDLYCVLRFGDDLGFKSTTLLAAEDIRRYIIPGYRRIIQAVHAAGKPFLLHSCGNIFNIMEDLITDAGIDAKHSNEDQIAPFPVWVERYGDRIGNFGGIDTDAVCQLDAAAMRDYIHDVIRQCAGRGGFAFGSGNSIPDYVPVEGYLTMIRTIREFRGDPAGGVCLNQ